MGAAARQFVLGVLAACIAFADAGSLRADDWPKAWQSSELADHPLVGRIFNNNAGRFIAPEDYLKALSKARNLLLGEVHDNADHHMLQALVIEKLRPKAVVFEHFQSDQQLVIDAFQVGQRSAASGRNESADRLFLATQWDASGWPNKEIYRPLIEAVLKVGATIIAGNVPRRRILAVAKNGLEALSQDARRAMWLDRPLGSMAGEDLDDALLVELEASHCGLMPKSAFGNMAIAQRLRDAHLASAMLSHKTNEGDAPVVLVAGNGHVRQDRGVPWYLAHAFASDRLERPGSLTVGHIEVADGKMRPEDYSDAMKSNAFMVFTPRAKRDDPCDKMRRRFGKPK